jgi:hypothetical protein
VPIYGERTNKGDVEDIHHLAGVGPMCVFAVPLTLKNQAIIPLSKVYVPSAGSISLGSDSLLTGTVSMKLRASVYPAARPSSETMVTTNRA